MHKKKLSELKTIAKNKVFWVFIVVAIFLFFTNVFGIGGVSYKQGEGIVVEKKKIKYKPIDPAEYDFLMLALANNPPQPSVPEGQTPPPPKPSLWPAKAPYPNGGAILPFKRVIAYYGNLYSKKMGVLGEYEEDVMLSKLDAEVKKWNDADPSTPALPALHYIAVVAQGSAGTDGKYRARMPGTEIDKVLKIAEKRDAIVFLDIQVGFSTIQTELPLLEKYLKLPNVHLGMDPEFSMKGTIRPGKAVGTYDAADVNFAGEYLAKLVRDNNLPPKILVVHRYTQKMLTNYQNIKPLPEVQMVIHMDGWGGKAKKKNTYEQFVYKEPVQFTGFKLFYKNDILDAGTVLFEPAELMKLRPIPIYIQYQ